MIDLGTGNNNKMYDLLIASVNAALIFVVSTAIGLWTTSRRYVSPSLLD